MKLLIWLAAGIAAVLAGRPLVFLAWVWATDPSAVVPPPEPGRADVSRFDSVAPADVFSAPSDPAEAERQLSELVGRAAREGRAITIGGARHSMGGHTLYPGGLAIDMRPFNRLSLDPARRILTAGAGARWSEVIPFLDARGLAVAVMQSNNDFTVGGSVSVNCHGWQHRSPPIASTVESFRLLLADGRLVRCSRGENSELFGLALGGYGLFGLILDVELRVVPNEYYRADLHRVAPADYAREYRRLTAGAEDIGMAYGRVSVAPSAFLADSIIVLLKRVDPGRPVAGTLGDSGRSLLRRIIFRGSVGSDYGKDLRWGLEKRFGQSGAHVKSRNQIMNESADWFATHDPGEVEILHEYFIPCDRFAEFLERSRPVFAAHRPDLLNVTVREVQPDSDTLLRYAREPVFGLVMLYHYPRTETADAAMAAFTRDLVDAALASGGTYYLPYRPHATRGQFASAYPSAAAFHGAKLRHDPAELFRNKFYENYVRPPVTASVPARSP